MNYIWENGEISNLNAKHNINIYSNALRYGTVLFDALLGKKSKNGYNVFRPIKHIERFLIGCKELGLGVSFTTEQLLKGIEQVIIFNLPTDKFGIRIFAYGNQQSFLGSETKLLIFLIDIKNVVFNKRVDLCVGPDFVYESCGVPASVKCTSHYVNRRAILIKHEGIVNGAYDDLVYTNRSGHILETSRANIFIIKDRKIISPKADTQILNGITRQSVVQFINDWSQIFGEKVIERDVFYNELFYADEVFLTSTSLGIEVVRSVNNRLLTSEVSSLIKYKFFEYIENNGDWFHNLLA